MQATPRFRGRRSTKRLWETKFKSREVLLWAHGAEEIKYPGYHCYKKGGLTLYVDYKADGPGQIFYMEDDFMDVLCERYVHRQVQQDHTVIPAENFEGLDGGDGGDGGALPVAESQPAGTTRKIDRWIGRVEARREQEELVRIETEQTTQYWNRRNKPQTNGNSGKGQLWGRRGEERLQLQQEETRKQKEAEIEEKDKKAAAARTLELEKIQAEQEALNRENEEEARKLREKQERENVAERTRLDLEKQQSSKLSEEQRKERDALARERENLNNERQAWEREQQKAVAENGSKLLELKLRETQLSQKEEASAAEMRRKLKKAQEEQQQWEDDISEQLASLEGLEEQAAQTTRRQQQRERDTQLQLDLLLKQRKAHADDQRAFADQLASLQAVAEGQADETLRRVAAALEVQRGQQQARQVQLDGLQDDLRLQRQEFEKQVAVLGEVGDAAGALPAALSAQKARQDALDAQQNTRHNALEVRHAQQNTREAALDVMKAKQDADQLALDILKRRLESATRLSRSGSSSSSSSSSSSGSPARSLPPADYFPESFDFRLFCKRPPAVSEAMQALDTLCLFRKTDKSYVAFNSDFMLVIAQNETLRSKLVASPCDCWVTAGKYIEPIARSHSMSRLWKNLYYQFGLMTQRLTEETLRPKGARQRELLIEQCKVVCTAAQGQLYADEAAFDERSEADLDVYQRGYNGSHGSLRWFLAAGRGEELHVDIRFLDKILTNWLVGKYNEDAAVKQDTIEDFILHNTFEIIQKNQKEAERDVDSLKQEIRAAVRGRGRVDSLDVSDECRLLLEGIARLKWKVRENAAAKAAYADLHNHASGLASADEPAASMLVVQAVEHHRRYTLHQP